jgi:hypothetical protein
VGTLHFKRYQRKKDKAGSELMFGCWEQGLFPLCPLWAHDCSQGWGQWCHLLSLLSPSPFLSTVSSLSILPWTVSNFSFLILLFCPPIYSELISSPERIQGKWTQYYLTHSVFSHSD